MAPRGKFMSQSMAAQKGSSPLGHRDLPQQDGSKRGKYLSFVSTRELSTPPFSPRLRSRVRNKARLPVAIQPQRPRSKPFNC